MVEIGTKRGENFESLLERKEFIEEQSIESE